MSVTDSRSSEDEDGRPPLPWQIQEAITAFDAVYTGALRAALDAAGVNGGGNMYRRGGAKMYHGLGGSLSP